MFTLLADDLRHAITLANAYNSSRPWVNLETWEYDGKRGDPTLWKDLKRNPHGTTHLVGEPEVWQSWLRSLPSDSFTEKQLEAYWDRLYGKDSFAKVNRLYDQMHLGLLEYLLMPNGLAVGKDFSAEGRSKELQIRFLEKADNGRIPLQVVYGGFVMPFGSMNVIGRLECKITYHLEFDTVLDKVFFQQPVSAQFEGKDSYWLVRAIKADKLQRLARSLRLLETYEIPDVQIQNMKETLLDYALSIEEAPLSDDDFIMNERQAWETKARRTLSSLPPKTSAVADGLSPPPASWCARLCGCLFAPRHIAAAGAGETQPLINKDYYQAGRAKEAEGSGAKPIR